MLLQLLPSSLFQPKSLSASVFPFINYLPLLFIVSLNLVLPCFLYSIRFNSEALIIYYYLLFEPANITIDFSLLYTILKHHFCIPFFYRSLHLRSYTFLLTILPVSSPVFHLNRGRFYLYYNVFKFRNLLTEHLIRTKYNLMIIYRFETNVLYRLSNP